MMYSRSKIPHVVGFLAASILILTALPILLHAQPESDTLDLTKLDSAQLYELGSVTVFGSRMIPFTPLSQDVINLAEINRSDASSVSDVIHEVPAARVQTNSRGESILYLRNAGERQVSIFLDGAMLNVPWDNRIDMSLVPLNAVGGMIAEKGNPSVLYGANVMGGAVNIVTRQLQSEGYLTELRTGVGENGYLNSSFTHLGNLGTFNYIGALSYSTRDGLPLSADANLPFSQPDPDLRTNTDSRLMSGYLRGEYRVGENDAIGLSLNVADAEKGVAPESNKDPEVESVRFWRYADWRNINVTGSYNLNFGSEDVWNLRGALWTAIFGQRIEQFGSIAYDRVEAAQTDDDLSLGARIILSRQLGETGKLSFSLNELFSGHDQVDSEFDSVGVEIDGPLQEYAQHTFSTGLEYNGELSSKISTVIGAGLDGMSTVKSADKPKQDLFLEPSLTAGLMYAIDDRNRARLSIGKKSRFPSMRELYGEALRRFLINTDLKPESSWNTDLGFEHRFENARIEVTGFAQLTSNTIDQRNVDTLGGSKRQRINLRGSRIFGVEIAGDLSAFRPFRLSGQLMWSSVRAITAASDGSDTLTFLSEKPEALGTLNLGYDFSFGLILDAEGVYYGKGYTLNDNNEFEELKGSLSFNGRIAYRLLRPITGIDLLELYARIDNATDALILPQLGLPGPGREVRGGLKIVL